MNETQEKLSWLAFRYVANELDAVEASDFESLLLTDQQAREAVAKAVEETTRIRQALAGAVVATAASQRSNWGHNKTRVAVAVVGSCLTLLLALLLVRSSLPISGDVVQQAIEADAPVSPALIAYAWAEARTDVTELQPAFDAEFAETMDSVLSGPVNSESEQSLVAPSWMLAALEKMDGGVDSNLDFQE